jgi:hypothetical protein
MGAIYSLLSYCWGQPKEVVVLLWNRWRYQWRLAVLGSKRSWKLASSGGFLLYFMWLWSTFGWRRHIIPTIELHVGRFAMVFRVVWVCFLLFLWSKLDIASYSEAIFNLFGDMELSHRGYFGYTVVVCCTLSWLLQLSLWSSSGWVRQLLRPYRNRLIMINLVVFVVLMSLGAQVARAKLGIRVWYPNERQYGDRIGAAYWD